MKTIGITWGDQAGVGPEVIEAALGAIELPEGVVVEMVGPRLDGVESGKPSLETARAALDALEEGAAKLKSGEIDAIVTGPVAKEGLHSLGFDFPGQTEFFAERLGCPNHAMCLTGEHLTVALVTVHVALSQVPRLVTQEEIVRVGHLLAEFCRQRGRQRPRIAVCGLNPHASENGAFGHEDREVVAPAIAQLNEEADVAVFSGPHSADTVFGHAVQGEYDAVLCMYHDQGLIPLKLLDFDTGVNTTLGLPRPRTSPDHGTAFAIAGKGIAKHSSMQHAIELAIELVQAQ
ncbi:4-hydroxythreonine-4-phosphate dehydrogenase PdxA [Rubritalea tangerina]|uniref:4-hydroxythreonine-4-phosphate dehydrogenase PdxA n=1 Tax=Rubritalea tangerina TaxID=430798 RepID=A0ABW4ZCA2_9BACT